MSRIFFAWELGQNFGHLSRQFLIAKRLQTYGHSVFFAARDCSVAAELLSSQGFSYTQAPFWHSGNILSSPPVNYAELLLAEGYGSYLGLQGMVSSWMALFHLYHPEIIIIDHSPTALLASYMAGIPAIQIGNGFEIPPNKYPFPSIRPWETITKTRLMQAETRVLETLNRICKDYHRPCFDTVQSFMRCSTSLLASFSELDHYGARLDETYIGPIYLPSRDLLIPWRESSRPHIFAYLRPSIPGFSRLLQALVDMTREADVTLVAPGIRKKHAETISSSRFHVYNKLLGLEHFCDKAALAISYGNFGTVSQFLLSGVPTLLVPQNIEQYLLSKQVERLGAGLMVDHNRSKADFTFMLQRLFQEPAFAQHAAAFSKLYDGYLPEQAVESAVRTIKSII